MKRIEIILENIKARKTRSRVPLFFFIEKIEIADKLLEKIHKKISSKRLLQEARKQYIISIVTASEVYFKDKLVWLIDKKKIDCSKFFDKEKLYTHSDIKTIIDKKITIGDLIASTFNFQNINGIEKAFSKALGIKFFLNLKNYKWYFGEESDEFVDLNPNFYLKLKKMLKLRHNFVHDINFKMFLNLREIKSFGNNLFDVIILTEFFIEDVLKGGVNKIGMPDYGKTGR